MNSAQRLLPFIILLFGAVLIWGRIDREIVRQVRAEELHVDARIQELRAVVCERAAKYPPPLRLCAHDWSCRFDQAELEAERLRYEQLLREFDELSRLRDERR